MCAPSAMKDVYYGDEGLFPMVEAGYAVLRRTWRAGDRITLELPMPVERTTICPPRCRLGAITAEERATIRSRKAAADLFDGEAPI